MCKGDFFYFFNRPTYMAHPNSIIEMTFTFYKRHFKKCSDTTSTIIESIDIVIPETDSCFTLANDALHQFTHTYINVVYLTNVAQEKSNPKGYYRINYKPL